MKRFFVLLTALALLFTAPCALSEAVSGAAAETTISATGTARLPVAADIAVITLSVRASDATVTAAQEQADAVLAQLHTALAEKGVSEADIQTTSYNVQTIYSYQYTKLGSEKETPSEYSVVSDLVVRVRDVMRVGEIIDAAILSGAESSYELSYESSEYDAVYSQALSAAVADAMRKAQLLAEASGLTLGALRSVTETGADLSTGTGAGEALSVTASVEVVYSVGK